MKRLLAITAVLEAATGLGLLFMPVTVAGMLLGTTLDAPAGVTVARVAGAALAALGLACWLSRDHGRPMVVAMLVYNISAVAVLIHAALQLALSGPGPWPAIGLHILLAAWCAAALHPAHVAQKITTP